MKSAAPVTFLDINVFPYEDFTSGLLIIVRELLFRAQALGAVPSIVSVAEREKMTPPIAAVEGWYTRVVQGIPAVELYLDHDPLTRGIKDTTRRLYEKLDSISPVTIILNTPAVFFSELHVDALEVALEVAERVVVIVFDSLFPKREAVDAALFERYCTLLKRCELRTISHYYAPLFEQETRLLPRYLFTPFNASAVIAPEGERTFITMINTHPIKGVAIFNRVAEMMPDESFLIVKNWPDVPPYKCASENVTFWDFCEDVRKVYERTKILLIPSLWKEGAARVVIEAMLNKIPVVCHDIGALSEISLGSTILISPPHIEGYRLEGTILYPDVSDTDVTTCAELFVSSIRGLQQDNRQWQQSVDKAYTAADRYCSEGNRELDKDVHRWVQHD